MLCLIVVGVAMVVFPHLDFNSVLYRLVSYSIVTFCVYHKIVCNCNSGSKILFLHKLPHSVSAQLEFGVND